jgi:hypothetical protein
MSTIINRNRTSAVVHVTANASIVVSGNSSVSNIAFGSGNTEIEETLTGAAIAQVFWGSAPGAHWNVKRGDSLVLTLPNAGSIDFAGSGCSLTANSANAVVVELVGASNGFIMLELQKIPTGTGYTS